MVAVVVKIGLSAARVRKLSDTSPMISSTGCSEARAEALDVSRPILAANVVCTKKHVCLDLGVVLL